MSSKLERRSFLSRLSLGIGGALLFPLQQWGKTKTSEMSRIIQKNKTPWLSMGNTGSIFILCSSRRFFPKR